MIHQWFLHEDVFWTRDEDSWSGRKTDPVSNLTTLLTLQSVTQSPEPPQIAIKQIPSAEILQMCVHYSGGLISCPTGEDFPNLMMQYASMSNNNMNSPLLAASWPRPLPARVWESLCSQYPQQWLGRGARHSDVPSWVCLGSVPPETLDRH